MANSASTTVDGPVLDQGFPGPAFTISAYGVDLMDADAPALARERRGRQIEQPYTRPARRGQSPALRPVPLQVRRPRPERPGVMLPERADPADLEPDVLQRGHDLTERTQLGVLGEHVARGEGPPYGVRPGPAHHLLHEQ